MSAMAGKPLSTKQYMANVHHSMTQTWSHRGSNYITESSFLRKEVTLPAGHTFHRLSLRAEETFGNHTYSTTNLEDFRRYATSFVGDRKEYGGHMHHISWTTTKDFKVPNLTTVLDTVKEVMGRESDLPASMATSEHALKWYQANSGGTWSGERVTALFSALKDKGYHAIVDEMDAGVQGDLPLVIFNHETLTSKVAEVFTSADLKKAQQSVTELLDRKL